MLTAIEGDGLVKNYSHRFPPHGRLSLYCLVLTKAFDAAVIIYVCPLTIAIKEFAKTLPLKSCLLCTCRWFFAASPYV